MSDHTPGPWRVESRSIIGTMQDGGPRRDYVPIHPLVATIASRAEEAANGRLIAAAPDLLAACEAVETVGYRLEENGYTQEVYDRLRAAIAKAKGE